MRKNNRRPDWRTKPAKKTIPSLRGLAYLNSPLFKIRLNRTTWICRTESDLASGEIDFLPFSIDTMLYYRGRLSAFSENTVRLFFEKALFGLAGFGATLAQGVNSAVLSGLSTSEVEYRRRYQNPYQNAENHIYPVAFPNVPDDIVDQVRARIDNISKEIYE